MKKTKNPGRRNRILFSSLCALALAASTGCASINWNGAKEIRPGVRYVKLEREEPRLMKAFMIRVDLQTPGLKFTGTGRDPKWGEQMPDITNRVYIIRTKRQRTAEEQLRLAREKFEAAQRREDAAKAALGDTRMTDEAKIAKMREIFG